MTGHHPAQIGVAHVDRLDAIGVSAAWHDAHQPARRRGDLGDVAGEVAQIEFACASRDIPGWEEHAQERIHSLAPRLRDHLAIVARIKTIEQNTVEAGHLTYHLYCALT